MGKKGASLVELIAVIVIMGIIAGIAIPTTIAVINRQRKNSVVTSLNNIYSTVIPILVQVETSSYDENITLIDDDFCYISLTTLIESGSIDGQKYKPTLNEIYFCYNMDTTWVVITGDTVSKSKPSTTGNAVVNDVEVTFNYDSNKFIIA